MKIKNKFILIFLLISTLPVIIIVFYAHSRYVNIINDYIYKIADTMIDNTVKSANEIISDIDSITEIFQLYTDSGYSIVDDLKKYKVNDGSYNVYDLWQSRNNMKFICQNLIYSNKFINGIFIFTPSGENIGFGLGDTLDIRTNYSPFDDEWYKETLKKKGKIYISNVEKKDFLINNTNSISFSRAIYDVSSHDFLGIIFIDCSPKILDLQDSNALSDNALITISKKDNSIIYSNIDSLSNNFNDSSYINTLRIITRDLSNEDLTLQAYINLQALYDEFNITKLFIIILSVICLIIFICISIILANNLTKPIKVLSDTMRNYKKNGLILTNKYLKRNDEIGILYNEYNNMIHEINTYIKTEYQNKLIILDSQMKSLEAQINSHFLYNTLESINSIAEIEEIESISSMSLALGNMFRYSIKTKSELVTLNEELKHVHDYITIQDIRFEGKFNIIYDIDDTLLNLKILKLILQPLVENSLYHGLNKCSISGTITISCHLDNKDIILTVSDNGVGISSKELNFIKERLKTPVHFTQLGKRTNQSIGIKNIDSRIKLYYGDNYGITINSNLTEGTRILIKIPQMKGGI